VAKILHHHGPTGRVHLEHRMRTRSELAALHRRSDCWLSLPHSEGWNLGAFDAAAEGTPVVTTGYGGPTEYLDADVSYLVPGQSMPSPDSLGASWVDPDIDSAVEALRSVWSDPQGHSVAALPQRDRLRRRYAPSVVAGAFMEFLGQIGVA
jgi:glycosyltransferase involved in cell wall biosynthesis